MSEETQSNKPNTDKASVSFPNRRSTWRASMDALTYLHGLSKKPELKIRQSDRITGAALIVSTTASISCLLLHKLDGFNLQLMGLCDFFLGVSLIVYVCNRLGVLTALPPRQAVLTWQLIQAFTFVGVFITVNAAIFLSLLLSLLAISHIHIPYRLP